MRRPTLLAVSAALLTLALTAPPAHAHTAGHNATSDVRAAAPCRPGSGPKLRGRNFTQTPLPANVRCADLTGAKFDEADLSGKDLTGAILRNASFKETELTQAYLEYADLTGADFTDADMTQMRAKHAKARNAVFTEAYGGQADFSNADLTGARFERAEMGQAEFNDATLVDADLTEAELVQLKGREADFTRAKLHDAKLGQATLQFAVFRDADLREAEFTQAEMRGAKLNGANVDKASFTQADDLDLTGAKGTAVNVPDDATGRRPEAEPTRIPVGEDTGGEPDEPRTTPAPRSAPPFGLVLIVLSSAGLALTLLLWSVTHRRRRREAAAFAIARRQAEEEVTRFGEEIDALDFEMKIYEATVSADVDWRQALDAYEAAKHILVTARTDDQLAQIGPAVRAGRSALGRLRSRRR
ncbi:pentapeptide repeat-containing protein [Thermopolyspora sp. NPDC052614]|uniref:pentapeptide repeat-containing protein n=1 Tax=Thermopolyspora sp. NPDC052614 TaxID=3155682 RepID=UPI0034158753